MQIRIKMVHIWTTCNSHSWNTLDNSNLGGIITFLPIIYFVIGDGDYIEMGKKSCNSKREVHKIPNFSKLCIVQFLNS